MRTYTVKITGKTPLLMHSDNIEWSDEMDAWKANPSNKKGSKAGDDRSPAYRWLGSLYHDGTLVGMPSQNIMTTFREGGTMVPVPGAKGSKTFKAQTQSGMVVEGTHWPVLVNGKEIPVDALLALKNEPSFQKHKAVAEQHGFQLFVKRAKVGTSKHVRVRPMFETWSVVGRVNVWDDQITETALRDIVAHAGLYKGLGDWRPSGKTPGSFGIFTAEIH